MMSCPISLARIEKVEPVSDENYATKDCGRKRRKKAAKRLQCSTHAMLLLILALTTNPTTHCTHAFVPNRERQSLANCSKLFSSTQEMDDITKLQAKARALLEKSKAKLAESGENIVSENDGVTTSVPFFANQELNGSKRDAVTKSTTTDGLITTDGEKMAELSEAEQWEVRGLLDVFESETKGSSSDRIADRDVAASIFNLRKVLQNEDYKRIFDPRNRFIGDN